MGISWSLDHAYKTYGNRSSSHWSRTNVCRSSKPSSHAGKLSIEPSFWHRLLKWNTMGNVSMGLGHLLNWIRMSHLAKQTELNLSQDSIRYIPDLRTPLFLRTHLRKHRGSCVVLNFDYPQESALLSLLDLYITDFLSPASCNIPRFGNFMKLSSLSTSSQLV